jgi:DNA uptake protein ComE-like DNA-binding protein
MNALRRLGRWFTRGGWYVVVVVGSLSMLSFVPFVHAALRLRRPSAWAFAVLYTAAVVGIFLMPSGQQRGGVAVGVLIVAAVHAAVLRRQVWSPAVVAGQDPAVAAVLAGRDRRGQARKIAATDPRMARELHIGRPDLTRTYDDGGLVDLNSAPPQVIAATCEIDPATAALIAEARDVGVPFATVEDVFAVVDIPYPLWDRIRDRSVVVAP